MTASLTSTFNPRDPCILSRQGSIFTPALGPKWAFPRSFRYLHSYHKLTRSLISHPALMPFCSLQMIGCEPIWGLATIRFLDVD